MDGARPRDAWIVWEEQGRYPNVIVELQSPSTASYDDGNLVPTFAETEAQRARTAEAENIRLRALLQKAGIDPDDSTKLPDKE